MYSELKALKFILDSGMLNKGTIEKANDEMIVEEKLNNHKYKVWQNKSNGRYMTYVSTENGDRKLLSKKTRRELANSLENNDKRVVRKRPRMIETIFNDWLE